MSPIFSESAIGKEFGSDRKTVGHKSGRDLNLKSQSYISILQGKFQFKVRVHKTIPCFKLYFNQNARKPYVLELHIYAYLKEP